MEEQYEIALSFATEDQKLVETVYHYLKAENIKVFFAPSREGQVFLAGKNQREAFYSMFGKNARCVALFVSKNYVEKDVPMEEASIAFAKHTDDGSVIPIYLDDAILPAEMFDPKQMNYLRSNNPAKIATHLAERVKSISPQFREETKATEDKSVMNIHGNTADKQIFIQNLRGI
mgnify:CR=1 FL=1